MSVINGIICDILSVSHFLPFIVFFLLLLAGFNLPFSEDLIIITSAIIAQERTSLFFPLYIAIYLGVVISDHIAYWIGFNMGAGIKKRKWFTKRVPENKILIIQKYLHNHGILTFIICRFIPFGVRNMLFMGSGFSKMDYRLFTIYDLIAATINTTTLYFLIYFLGVSVQKPFKTAGIILFVILIAVLLTLTLNFFVFKKDKSDDTNDKSDDTNGKLDDSNSSAE